ncbi:14990_t:CDS:2, partial [Racocetra fulgida]
KDIINASMKEIEDKNKEIDTLNERLTAAEQQKNKLAKEQADQEQKEKSEREKEQERERQLKAQREKQKKLETEQQANARKLEDYEKMLKEAKNERERLQIYEQKLISLTALVQDKDREIETITDEEKNARINALNLEKAALENKEIGYKGKIELLEKQKKDLQEYQLKLSNEKAQEEQKNQTLRQT